LGGRPLRRWLVRRTPGRRLRRQTSVALAPLVIRQGGRTHFGSWYSGRGGPVGIWPLRRSRTGATAQSSADQCDQKLMPGRLHECLLKRAHRRAGGAAVSATAFRGGLWRVPVRAGRGQRATGRISRASKRSPFGSHASAPRTDADTRGASIVANGLRPRLSGLLPRRAAGRGSCAGMFVFSR
jgi:hypothetical protein